jgi:sec-independent protein translocase protein TatB
MLPGIGGSELIIIAIVALVVVGPKDLPKLLRNIGKFVGKMRNMADDFKASFDDMARQSELDDLRKEVEALRNNTIGTSIQNDIRAIESDVRDSLARSDAPAATEITDPQLDGLPPKWNAGQVDTADLPEPEPAPAKKPRVRKKAVVAETPPEMAQEATVAPVRRSRKKAAS